jgi:protein with PEP-CTERM/exosortase system signal
MVLALASLNNAPALGITLNQVNFGIGPLSLNVSPPFSSIHVDNLTVPSESPNYEFSWGFANLEDSATFAGFSYIRGGSLSTSARFAFTLTEAADFLLSGGVRQSEWIPTSFTTLTAALGPYQISHTRLDLQTIGTIPTPLSGTLLPGNYLFTTNVFSTDAESSSSARLRLTTASVPDGGSTIMLLGFGLSALGLLSFRRVAA